MRKLNFLACLLLLACGSSSVAADMHRGYRLAGVMSAGDSYLGFLEVPQGGQVLVRLGSVVDGGEVVAFDATSLRLRFPDGVVELSLEGSGKPPPAPASHDVVVSGDQKGHVIRREVDVAELDAALEDGERSRSGNGPPAASESQVVARRFAPLLDLPAGARVVAVNEQQVTSADAAIGLVQDTLASGLPARLNLQTSKGMQRVYLRPAGQGGPAPPRP